MLNRNENIITMESKINGMKKNIAVIGGGAAGLMAAAAAGKHNTNIKIDLYEKNDTIGKKILASGNGRCNINNTDITKDNYSGHNNSFIEYAMNRLGFKQFEKFCSDIGLLLNTKDNGRVYPLSNEAKSVITIFTAYLRELGVNIFTNVSINKVKKVKNKFIVFQKDKILKEYDKVLISTGLSAAPQLGGNAVGLEIAENFGHTVYKPYPSLVSLEIDSNICKKMAGVKCNAEVSLYTGSKKIQKTYGDILFTKYGISGLAILDISEKASFHLSQKANVSISVNLLPKIDKQYISTYIHQTAEQHKTYSVFEILCGILNMKIARAVLYEINANPENPAKEVGSKLIKSITDKIFDWRFKVRATHGFEYAQVSGGGIKTNEINNKTMESKIVKDLYFAGEVLDITGMEGGYNLAFSFASGYLSGIDMCRQP